MSMQDTIADLLTHIRNGQAANKKSVQLPSSKMKIAIVKVLQDEGYIEEYTVLDEVKAKPELRVGLKYFRGSPVISKISRVSRPGLRVYKQNKDLPSVLGGLGISIISTSQGIMSNIKARKMGCGGEILCQVE